MDDFVLISAALFLNRKVTAYGSIALLLLSSSLGLAAPHQANNTKAVNEEQCAASSISLCSDIHAIVTGGEFRRSLTLFLGPKASDGAQLLHKGRLVDQVEEILSGPVDERHQLRDNRYLFTTCRTSECSEGGAVALNDKGKIVAIAVISLHCEKMSEGCLDRPVLDLFMHDKKAEAATRDAIFAWASR